MRPDPTPNRGAAKRSTEPYGTSDNPLDDSPLEARVDILEANGRGSNYFHILDYVPSNISVDDVVSGAVMATSYIQAAAEEAIAEKGVIVLPSSCQLRYDDLLIHANGVPLAVQGGPWMQTKLIPDDSYTGPAIVVEGTWRNGEGQVDDLTWNSTLWLAGCSITGLAFIAEDWSTEHHGILVAGRNDLLHFRDLYFGWLSGTALSFSGAEDSSLNAFTRECLFEHIRIEQCGNASTNTDCLNINTKIDAGDGTNHLTFDGLELVYNNGPARIYNDAGADENSRRITFQDLMLHGKGTGTTSQDHHLLILEGRLTDVVVNRMKTNSAKAGYYSVIVREDANNDYPKQIQFSDCSLSNAGGGGFRIERCGVLEIKGYSQGGVAIQGQEVSIASGALDGDCRIDLRAAPDVARNFDIHLDQWSKVSGTLGPIGNYKKWEDETFSYSTLLYGVCGSTTTAVATLSAASQSQGTVTGAASTTLGWESQFATAASIDAVAGANSSSQLFTAGAAGEFGAGARSRVRGLVFPDASYDNTGASTGSRIFVGLSNQAVATSVNSDDPAGHRAGFQRINVNAGKTQTNWQFSTKNNVSENLVDTGIAFTPGNVYDLEMIVLPNSAGVIWRIIDWTTETMAEGITTDSLPGEGVAMRYGVLLSTVNATARNIKFVNAMCNSLT